MRSELRQMQHEEAQPVLVTAPPFYRILQRHRPRESVIGLGLAARALEVTSNELISIEARRAAGFYSQL